MTLFSDSELLMIAVILDEEEHEEKQSYKKNKRLWVHQAWKKRVMEGEFSTLYKELMDDGDKFFEYFRMSENSVMMLLRKLEVQLKTQKKGEGGGKK